MTKVQVPLDTRAMGIFIQVVRNASFTLAGERLNMSASAVSKAISRLEADLGIILLHRNPRAVIPTSEGARFFEEAENLNLAIERVRHAVSNRCVNIKSSLRVTLPMHFGRTVVLRHLPRFSERNPDLKIEYLLVNGQLDPVEHGVDVALWFSAGAWIDSRLVIKNVSSFATLLCAAPAYLERHGTPRHIGDLERHRILNGVDEKTGRLLPWNFQDGIKQINYTPHGNIISNSLDLIFAMALGGGGIVYVPDYLVEEAIRLGELRVILPQLKLEPCPVQLVYPRARANDPAVKAIVAMLTDIVQLRQGSINQKRKRALA